MRSIPLTLGLVLSLAMPALAQRLVPNNVQDVHTFVSENICPYPRNQIDLRSVRALTGREDLTLTDIQLICGRATGRRVAVVQTAGGRAPLPNFELIERARRATVSVILSLYDGLGQPQPSPGNIPTNPTFVSEYLRLYDLRQATGFHVGNGLIITNLTSLGGVPTAVADNGTIVFLEGANANNMRLRVELGDGSVRQARLVYFDPTTDTALLAVKGDTRNLAALPVATGLPSIGQRVLTMSYPIGALPVTATEGMVMGIRPYGRMNLLQINAATSSGSQGAPVLDDRGAVVGVVAVKNPTLFQLAGSILGSENVGFAVPIGTVLQRLNLATRGGH
ncbi:Serine protease [Gloeomargarita lithophora Alchichica-D10]|uniref:Serine protease n=1 Tax=Gloeomargarita lithophora Alchichica-D10 TaxID=1188229 RepID=A0A1J0AFD6_9CYAN|nr:serine protease [Gloeomargarita lithophora]APB34619.1 Serine protease [Gloeomargarita lithophora Alchichica-D10]